MLSVASETLICAHALQSYRIYVQPQVSPLCENCVPLSPNQPPTEMPRVCCPRGDAEVRHAPLGQFLTELSLRRHPRYQRQSLARLLPPASLCPAAPMRAPRIAPSHAVLGFQVLPRRATMTPKLGIDASRFVSAPCSRLRVRAKCRIRTSREHW